MLCFLGNYLRNHFRTALYQWKRKKKQQFANRKECWKCFWLNASHKYNIHQALFRFFPKSTNVYDPVITFRNNIWYQIIVTESSTNMNARTNCAVVMAKAMFTIKKEMKKVRSAFASWYHKMKSCSWLTVESLILLWNRNKNHLIE